MSHALSLRPRRSIDVSLIAPSLKAQRLAMRQRACQRSVESSTATRPLLDRRSGITSDPKGEDDPQYIVRLVGQVIRVSLETVEIVKGLPGEFEPV